MRALITTLAAALCGACGAVESPIASWEDAGTVPNPPGVTARDVGVSIMLAGRSVWVFGDTLFPEPAADGFQWRSGSWSSTAPGLVLSFTHALGADGKSAQLLPHSDAELAFNQAHRAEPRRLTPWSQAVVSDGQGAVVFYVNMRTGPGGAFDFESLSGSVARWDDPARPAVRVEPPLFAGDEPDWGAAALLLGKDIYVYGCDQGRTKPCKLARVPFAAAADRSAYTFFDGTGWSADWHQAKVLFDGAPLFSVHWVERWRRFFAFYMRPGGCEMRVRSAPAPEGPWTDAADFGVGLAPSSDFDYALLAHPELTREGGAVEVLSYTRPSGPLQQETRLVTARWSEAAVLRRPD